MKLREILNEMIDVRNVTRVELDDVDSSDHPDYADAHISSAAWKDSGKPLTDAELEELNKNSDFVYDQISDHMAGRGEDAGSDR